jgi:GntR family transcriptional regulator, transcriptional repressor for pyruvate dehydrogenase complex
MVWGNFVDTMLGNDVQEGQGKKTGTVVIDRIKRLIESESYQPGMKLPTERKLADLLGVGRPAVREAIKALSILDVVESRRGDGTYLKSTSALTTGWPERVHQIERNFDMLQLLEVRKMIEPFAAALAAVRASARQVHEMERELLLQEENLTKRSIVGKHDYLFHDAILRAAANPILADLTAVLAPLFIKSRQITTKSAPNMDRMLSEHRAIFEAIRRGQPDLATRAMLDHLQTVGIDLITEAPA